MSCMLKKCLLSLWCTLSEWLLSVTNYNLKNTHYFTKTTNHAALYPILTLSCYCLPPPPNYVMFPCVVRGLCSLKYQRIICLPKGGIHPSKLCNCLVQCSESLFYFLLVSWRTDEQNPHRLDVPEKQRLSHWAGREAKRPTSVRLRSRDVFPSFTAAVCSATRLTRMYRRTLPCGVCLLWGSVASPRLWASAVVAGVGPVRYVWLGHEACVRLMIWLSAVSFKNLSPIKAASQTLVRSVMKTKWLQGKSARNGERESGRRKLFLWWPWNTRRCEESDSKGGFNLKRLQDNRQKSHLIVFLPLVCLVVILVIYFTFVL